MASQDFFRTAIPQNTFLRQFISYYYFHSSEEEQVTQKFIFHPHYKAALTLYKSSDSYIKDGIFFTIPNTNENYCCHYSGIITASKLVSIQTPFHKVGIVFQPLGLNHFIPETLAEITSQYSPINFSYFNTMLSEVLDLVFDAPTITEKVQHLDHFFSERFIGFTEERLTNGISLILNTNHNFTVQELADQLQIHRKTLLRLFNKHLVCSVKDYLNIVRFRKTLETYQASIDKPKLTELAYGNAYYDQAEFINHFKRITGTNPSKLFKGINHIGKQDTYWTILA